MNVALLLGLVSALCYGITDYLARIAGRSVGVWRSMFYGDLAALLTRGLMRGTLASAVTVLLSRLIDRAAIALHQWLAMGVIIAGLILIRG